MTSKGPKMIKMPRLLANPIALSSDQALEHVTMCL